MNTVNPVRTVRAWMAGVVVLAGLSGAPELAAAVQSSPPLASGLDVEPRFTASLDQIWGRYQRADQEGDAQLSARFLGEIRRLRAERNAFYLQDIALAFGYRGSDHLARGELDLARLSFQTARELDPTLPAAHLGLAQVAWRSGGAGVVVGIGHAIQGYLAAFGSPSNGAYAWADLFLLTGIALGLAVVVFAALMLYRYGYLLHHDLSERLEEKLGDRGVLAVTIAILLLPVLLTFGAFWLLPYWLVATFAYQTVRERALSITALVALVLAGPLVAYYTSWSRTLVNPLFHAALSSVDGSFDLSDLFLLREASARQPEDRELKMLLAAQYKNLGEYDLAAAVYRDLLSRDPSDLAAQINLGNIYFAQRDWEGAIHQYSAAIETAPDFALAHYNKSVAHGQNFQFAERKSSRERADRLDRSRVARLERQGGDYPVVGDVRLGPEAILAKFFGREEGFHPEPVSTWERAFSLRSEGARFLLGGLVLGAILAGLELGFPGRRMTRGCWKCGSAFCGRCQIGTGRKGLCTQCYHLFFVKDGVSAMARNEKLARVKESGRRRNTAFRILSVCAPGAGQIAEDATLLGAALLVVWAGAIAILVSSRFLYPLPGQVLGLGTSLPHYLAGLALVAALVSANVFGRPRGQG